MNDIRYKRIFDLAEQVEEKEYKVEYERLQQVDKSSISFNEYVGEEIKRFNNPNVDNKQVDKAYIKNDKVEKNNILFSIYLIQYNHIDQVILDENYKPLPLKKNELYEYGTIITFSNNIGKYSINNLFGGIEEDKTLAIKKYDELKNIIQNKSEDELLEMMENNLKNQLK